MSAPKIEASIARVGGSSFPSEWLLIQAVIGAALLTGSALVAFDVFSDGDLDMANRKCIVPECDQVAIGGLFCPTHSMGGNLS